MGKDYFSELLTDGALEVIPLKFSKAGVRKVIEDIENYPRKVDRDYGNSANPVRYIGLPETDDSFRVINVVLKKRANIVLDTLFGNFEYWDDEDGISYGENYRDYIGFTAWQLLNDRRYWYFERDGRKLCEGTHFHDTILGLPTHQNCHFPNYFKRMCDDMVSIFRKHALR